MATRKKAKKKKTKSKAADLAEKREILEHFTNSVLEIALEQVERGEVASTPVLQLRRAILELEEEFEHFYCEHER